MEEAAVRGAIMGVVLGLIAAVVTLALKLHRSRSEGARRLKLVCGVALVLLTGSGMVAAFGVTGTIITSLVIAIIFWVVKGFKKNDSSTSTPTGSASHESDKTLAKTLQFTDAEEPSPDQKSVIACPQCGGKLRVVSGKFIDVTCAHCKLIFRTHT